MTIKYDYSYYFWSQTGKFESVGIVLIKATCYWKTRAVAPSLKEVSSPLLLITIVFKVTITATVIVAVITTTVNSSHLYY